MSHGNVIPFDRNQSKDTKSFQEPRGCLILPKIVLRYTGYRGAIVFAELYEILNRREEELFDFAKGEGAFFWVRLPLKWWSGNLGISIGTLRKSLMELEAMSFITSRQNQESFDKTKWYAINYGRLT